MKNKTYSIPVEWEEWGKVEIDAESYEDAVRIVREDKHGNIELPQVGHYLDGTFKIDEDGLDHDKLTGNNKPILEG